MRSELGREAEAPVTSEEVLDRFGRSASARRAFEGWRTTDSRQLVVPRVLEHENRVALISSAADIRQIAKATVHALGDANRRVAESVTGIVNWHPDFAMTHVLAFITESLARVPTYQEFREAAQAPPFRNMLWEPAQIAIAEECRRGTDPKTAHTAMRWRIGNSYYSFLREVYAMAGLRDRGLNVRSHPLADALFRVDFWIGDVNVDLYVGNPQFRRGNTGRKPRSSTLLGDAQPQFSQLAIEIPSATRFGVVHLPDDEAIGGAANEIRELVDRSDS